MIKRSQAAETLVFKGHPIQIFADLSPYIVQKRWSLKPLIQVLPQKELSYRWFFLFHLNFSYCNKSCGFYSFQEGERPLLYLGLLSYEIHPPSISRGLSSTTKRPSHPSPFTPVWQKQQPKRSKESQQSWNHCTSWHHPSLTGPLGGPCLILAASFPLWMSATLFNPPFFKGTSLWGGIGSEN